MLDGILTVVLIVLGTVVAYKVIRNGSCKHCDCENKSKKS